jgi:hypothetical protein
MDLGINHFHKRRIFSWMASFAFTVKISAKREAPDVATFDESIAEGAMDEEKGATDGCLAAGRKLTVKANEASQGPRSPLRSKFRGSWEELGDDELWMN